MTLSPAETAALLRALRACSRGAARRLLPDEHPLRDPTLAAAADRVLLRARGPAVDASSPFPATVWRHGATHVGKTSPGVPFAGTVGDFVDLLRRRSTEVAPKRSGWVAEPTLCPTGLRTNAGTRAICAVLLDADEAGPWDETLAALDRIGVARIAYQSGGWTEARPKWRVAVPLAAPLPTPDDAARATWKAVYLAARVLVGAVGRLPGAGFDAATDAPSCPWFLTERRHADDPPREVSFRPGASIDLVKLAMVLPAVEEDDRPAEARPKADRVSLAEGRLDEVVSALVPVTSEVHSGRRDLYLSLPGALLDRGVSPDDVVEICEAVSAAYPGGDAERHADNVRSARCTVATWERTGVVTRIGTLHATWPDVARALDDVLPDPWGKMMADAMARLTGGGEAPPDPPGGREAAVAAERARLAAALPPMPPAPPTSLAAAISPAQVRAIVRRKRCADSARSKWDADLIENFAAGERLVAPLEIEKFPQLGKFDGEEGLARVAWVLGCCAPRDVPWDAIVNLRPQAARAPFDRDALARAGARYDAARARRAAREEGRRREEEEARRDRRARVDAGVPVLRDGRTPR